MDNTKTNITELAFCLGYSSNKQVNQSITLLPNGYQKKGESYEQAVERRKQNAILIQQKLEERRKARQTQEQAA